MSALRLYTDRTYAVEGAPHTPLLIPFWGTEGYDNRYRRFAVEGRQFLEMTGPADADVAVLPTSWEHVQGNPDAVQAARSFAEASARQGLRLIVFFISDSTEPVPIPDAVVLRTSLNRSQRRRNEWPMPALSLDVRDELAGRQPPPFRTRPVVGFCGFAPGAEPLSVRSSAARVRRRLRAARGELPASLGVRARALDALRRSGRVEVDAVVRDAFWAGAVRDDGTIDQDRMTAARRDFVSNLGRCDYTLCARGGGNFSYRLYETMSAGRIPIFVDTDSVLPLENVIDWRSLVIWVDETDVGSIGDIVAEQHARLGEDGYAERASACREAWDDLLSPHGFFRHVDEATDGALERD